LGIFSCDVTYAESQDGVWKCCSCWFS